MRKSQQGGKNGFRCACLFESDIWSGTKERKINMNHFIKVEERRRVDLVMRRTLMADHLPTFEILSDSFITFVKSCLTPYQHTPMSLHNIAAVIQKKKVISGFILKTSQRQNIAAEFSLTHRWTHLQFLVCCVSNARSRPSGSFGPKQNLPQ